jgi:2-hydroxy-3-oxopropionate reductase
MIDRTFAPGFRIRLHQKDLTLALEAAREMAITPPGTALASELFEACIGAGQADLDHSAVITAVEDLAGDTR